MEEQAILQSLVRAIEIAVNLTEIVRFQFCGEQPKAVEESTENLTNGHSDAIHTHVQPHTFLFFLMIQSKMKLSNKN